jgi:hypothetical protein
MVKRIGKRKWVKRLQSSSDAMDLGQGVFKKKSAKGVAESILRSVKRWRPKKGVAAVECLFILFGTVLAVFTLVVLLRESVKRMFEANKTLAQTGTAV